jgi:hypothetical protein
MKLAKQFLLASLLFWVAGVAVSLLDSWLATAPMPRHEFDTWGSKLGIWLCFIGCLSFLVSLAQFVAALFGRQFVSRSPKRKNGA